MAVKSFRESIAWQRAMDLSHEIYQVTRMFPKEEIFGLTNQLRRASVSIASNSSRRTSRPSRRSGGRNARQVIECQRMRNKSLKQETLPNQRLKRRTLPALRVRSSGKKGDRHILPSQSPFLPNDQTLAGFRCA